MSEHSEPDWEVDEINADLDDAAIDDAFDGIDDVPDDWDEATERMVEEWNRHGA